MSTRRAITRNMIVNVVGMAVPTLTAFLVAPFLIHHLGHTNYGLWILIGSFSGYFGLLDFGVKGAVGRNMALHLAKGDQERVNSILSTALAYLCGVGCLVVAVTFVVPWVFFQLFDVPPGEVDSVQAALILIGINLALTLPLNVFDATLYAIQRFDVLNAIDIPTVVLRAGLMVYLVGHGFGLVSLAVVTLVTTVGSALVKAILSFRASPGLRLGPAHVGREAAHSLFGYGVWYFLLSFTRMLPPQISPLVIGSRLSVELVTPYSLAGRMITYANAIIGSATGVLTPVATTLHAQENHDQQRKLFLQGGKCCLGLSLFFLLWFVFLGGPFLRLWIGSPVPPAPRLLTILALGEVLPMAQWVTQSLVLGMGRHKVVAWVSVLEIVTATTLSLFLVGPYGLEGVAFAFAVPGALCRGVFLPLYGCGLAGVRLEDYPARVVLPVSLAALLPGVGLSLLTRWSRPEGWVRLVAYTTAFGVVYLACFLLIVGGRPPKPAAESWDPKPAPEPEILTPQSSVAV